MFEEIREAFLYVNITRAFYQRNYNVKKRENVVFSEENHLHNHEFYNV